MRRNLLLANRCTPSSQLNAKRTLGWQLFVFLAAALVVPVAPVSAQSTAPGRYKEWNQIDSVQIVQAFKLADYNKLVVAPLDKSEIKLPDESDNMYAPTKKILEESDAFFIERLTKGIADFRKDFVVEKGAEGNRKGLHEVGDTFAKRLKGF